MSYRLRKRYIANAFSLSMLELPYNVDQHVGYGSLAHKLYVREAHPLTASMYVEHDGPGKRGQWVGDRDWVTGKYHETAHYEPGYPTSIVGHESTARIYEAILGIPVAVNRASVRLEPGDSMLVGQYTGPRLPEGALVLPEGATIQWVMVFLDR